MSARCCHHRWMCHVVNRALAHEWYRWCLCDQLHGYHQISHGTPWSLPDIWRYVGNSTNQMTKSSRSGNDASRKHQLSFHTTLPTQNVTPNVVHNKVQLINFICHYLINPNPTPVQVWNSFSLQRKYLKTNHEEADVIIVHHVVRIASEASDDLYIKVYAAISIMSLSSWFAFISRKIWQWMSAWRAHVLGERSYPPNGTETQAYHQTSACRTRPDRVWYGIISVWHWKGHILDGIDGRTSPHRTRSTCSRWRQADLQGTFVAACYGSTVQGDMNILTVTRRGSLKSWTLSGMDGMQAMMALRCIQPHLQLGSLLYR